MSIEGRTQELKNLRLYRTTVFKEEKFRHSRLYSSASLVLGFPFRWFSWGFLLTGLKAWPHEPRPRSLRPVFRFEEESDVPAPPLKRARSQCQSLTDKSHYSPWRTWIKIAWEVGQRDGTMQLLEFRFLCTGSEDPPVAATRSLEKPSGGDGCVIAQGIQEGNYKRIRVKVYILPSTNVNDH